MWSLACTALLPGRAPVRRHSPSFSRLSVVLSLDEQAESEVLSSGVRQEQEPWSIQYELLSDEVTIDQESASAGLLAAYETEEKPMEGEEHAEGERAALLVLPDASGWRGVDARALADRLAIFCGCLVVMPDLLRGEEPCTAPRDSEAYRAWLSGLPSARLDADVRECIAYLRADRQVRGPVGLLGLGLGGGQVVRTNSVELQLAAAVAICPRHYELAALASARAPTLCLHAGGGEAASAQLEEARRALLGAEPAPSAPASTAAAAVVDVSDHHYESLKVKELQEALRGRGLPTSGRKAELLQRLQADDAAARPAAPPAASSAQAPPRHMLLPSEGAARLCDDGDGPAAGDDALLLAEGWLNAHMRAQ